MSVDWGIEARIGAAHRARAAVEGSMIQVPGAEDVAAILVLVWGYVAIPRVAAGDGLPIEGAGPTRGGEVRAYKAARGLLRGCWRGQECRGRKDGNRNQNFFHFQNSRVAAEPPRQRG